jgi:chromosomal replication initiator protein
MADKPFSKAEVGPSPLPFVSRCTPELSHFVVGGSNRLAHAAISAVANGETRYNPISLVGGVGVGKTLLLTALRRHFHRHCPGKVVVYMKMESFCNAFMRALRERKMEKFQDHFRRADLLFFDELDFLEGKPGTQGEFFSTIDTVLSRGNLVICASNTHPREIKMKESIISRLLGGLVVAVDPICLEVKRGLLSQLLVEEGLSWSEAVQDLVLQHVDGDARGLIGVFDTIMAHQRLLGEDLNEDLVLRVLSSYRGGKVEPRLSFEKIESVVEEYFGLFVGQHLLRQAGRSGSVARARHIAMYLTHHLIPGLNLAEIGDYYCREHTTVCYAIGTIDKAKHQGHKEVCDALSIIRSQLGVK